MSPVAVQSALAYLGSEVFDGRHYAWVFSEYLWAEHNRLTEWNTYVGESFIELQPSQKVLYMADLAMSLRGNLAVSNEEVIFEALTIMDMSRGVDGRLPFRTINNYMTLREALSYGDVDDESVQMLAKTIIFANMRDTL